MSGTAQRAGSGSAPSFPDCGTVWWADLSPTRGREQRGLRPVLVVSPGRFNRGALVIGVPFTRTDRRTPLHVPVEPPEGGLRETSYAMCEQVRALARERLLEPWGLVSTLTMRAVAGRLHLLLPQAAAA
jgi:mRNA interferase MazF